MRHDDPDVGPPNESAPFVGLTAFANLTGRRLERARGFAEAIAAYDGVAAFNEETMLSLDTRPGIELFAGSAPDVGAPGVTAPLVGLAVARDADDGREAEFAIAPQHRRAGLGTSLFEALHRGASPATAFWAHGLHPGARRLAERAGLDAERVLHELSLDLRTSAPGRHVEPPAGLRLRPFDPARDADALLEVNASAFRSHPEQGSLDRAGLEARMRQPWFSAADLLLLERPGPDEPRLRGFCWLKREGDAAELYVLGVDPAAQGRGLGAVLLEAGLERARSVGATAATLYVDDGNRAAMALYRRAGFAIALTDVRYRDRTTPNGPRPPI